MSARVVGRYMPLSQQTAGNSGNGVHAGTGRYSRRTCGKVESRLRHRSWLETMSTLQRQTVTSMPWAQPRERACGNTISKSPWLRPQPFPVTGFGLEAATGLSMLFRERRLMTPESANQEKLSAWRKLHWSTLWLYYFRELTNVSTSDVHNWPP